MSRNTVLIISGLEKMASKVEKGKQSSKVEKSNLAAPVSKMMLSKKISHILFRNNNLCFMSSGIKLESLPDCVYNDAI